MFIVLITKLFKRMTSVSVSNVLKIPQYDGQSKYSNWKFHSVLQYLYEAGARNLRF